MKDETINDNEVIFSDFDNGKRRISEIPAEPPPRRPAVRRYIYSTLYNLDFQKVTIGEIESAINDLIDLVIEETKKGTE